MLEPQELSQIGKAYEKKRIGDETCVIMTRMKSSGEGGDQKEARNAEIVG